MICPSCSHSIDESVTVCPACNRRLSEVSPLPESRIALYGRMWRLALQSKVFWLGMVLLLAITLWDHFMPEARLSEDVVKPARLVKLLFLLGGIIVADLGFVTNAPGTLSSRVLGGLVFGAVCIGAGFFVNSLFAEVFKYSLKPAEAPCSWLVIGVTSVVAGSFVMFGRFKEQVRSQ